MFGRFMDLGLQEVKAKPLPAAKLVDRDEVEKDHLQATRCKKYFTKLLPKSVKNVVHCSISQPSTCSNMIRQQELLQVCRLTGRARHQSIQLLKELSNGGHPVGLLVKCNCKVWQPIPRPLLTLSRNVQSSGEHSESRISETLMLIGAGGLLWIMSQTNATTALSP